MKDIEAEYFTTFDYNKFTSEIFQTKIKEKGLLDKCSIYYLIKILI